MSMNMLNVRPIMYTETQPLVSLSQPLVLEQVFLSRSIGLKVLLVELGRQEHLNQRVNRPDLHLMAKNLEVGGRITELQ